MNPAFLSIIACGAAGGLLFQALRVPGGAMLDAVLAVMAVRLPGVFQAPTPGRFQPCAQIAMGIVAGNMMTAANLAQIRAMLPLMAATTGLLLLGGFVGSWLVYRTTGMDIPSAILATSPGGLNAVVGLAADMGDQAPAVMAFQVARLYTVILLAPLLSYILHLMLKQEPIARFSGLFR